MRGKWAAGIRPRNFTWVVQDRLALSERPGGFAPTHRRVRRQEELIWLRAQGFTKIVSLLPSQHNLQAYEDQHIAHAHFPLVPGNDPRPALTSCYAELESGLRGSDRVLVHSEELGDRVMGVAAGFLVWSGRVASEPQAIALVEQLVGHQMRSAGRELVVVATALARTRERSVASPPHDGAYPPDTSASPSQPASPTSAGPPSEGSPPQAAVPPGSATTP